MRKITKTSPLLNLDSLPSVLTSGSVREETRYHRRPTTLLEETVPGQGCMSR
jgi:hypothetical protein